MPCRDLIIDIIGLAWLLVIVKDVLTHTVDVQRPYWYPSFFWRPIDWQFYHTPCSDDQEVGITDLIGWYRTDFECHWNTAPKMLRKIRESLNICLFIIAICLVVGQAPRYLTDLCVPVSNVSAQQHLRSATRRLLVVPRCRLSTLGPQTFSVADPSLWNSLPDSLRDPHLGRDNLRRLLKTHVFTLYWNN